MFREDLLDIFKVLIKQFNRSNLVMVPSFAAFFCMTFDLTVERLFVMCGTGWFCGKTSLNNLASYSEKSKLIHLSDL